MKFKLWFEADEWQKFQRQKLLPFMNEPERPFARNATTFLGKDTEDYGLKDSQYEPGKLYHVTTNLSAVKIDSRLKSRAELGGKGIGLGGGPSNMSPRTVSLTYNYGKALEIYEGLKFVANIISGKMPASAIYDYVTSNNDNQFDDMGEQLSNVDRVLLDYGVPKEVVLSGDEQNIKAILDKELDTPKWRYHFLQELETAVLDDNPTEDNSDSVEFNPVVGFTAPFEQISGLVPQNIAIIQVVLRKDAETSHYVQEAELRVDPKDLAIVRYLQPK
jgi:hypothetical protein